MGATWWVGSAVVLIIHMSRGKGEGEGREGGGEGRGREEGIYAYLTFFFTE